MKPKIAILVSGQLRDYNENYKQWKESIDTLFKDFDYHLYGLTWEDQPTPINVQDFVAFTKQDQNIIYNTLVNGNIFNKIPFRQQWTEMSEFKKILKGESNTTLNQWLRETITPAYSQIFGLQLCSQQVPSKYSMYVKYRWDIGIADYIYEDNKDSWHKTLLDFAQWQGEFKESPGYINTSVCTFSPAILHGNCKFIQDMCFLYKQDVHKKLSESNFEWEYTLTKIIESIGWVPTAHELWAEFFIALNKMIYVQGPACVTHSANGQSSYKPHKRWSI